MPPQKWNGVTFMFAYSINDAKQYPQDSPSNHGTFDWTQSQFYVPIPKDVSETGTINFSLQVSSGTIYLSINFIIDLHSAPGGRSSNSDFNMYYNEEYAQILQLITKVEKGSGRMT